MSDGRERDGRRRRRNGREILPLTMARLDGLLEPCDECAFWELAPARFTKDPGAARVAKHEWLSSTLLEWGSPGRIAYVDGVPAGYLTFAPAGLAPRALAFPTAPVSADALVLLTVRVRRRYAGQGLGRALVQTAAKDVLSRGHRALEAFVSRAGDHCLVPEGFLHAVGFATVREHPAYPRLRLDLGTAVSWLAEMESAVERLLAPVRELGGPRPVGSAHQVAQEPTRG